MITIGIDPGLSGAIGAVLEDGSALWVRDLPVSRDKSLAWISGDRLHDLLFKKCLPAIALAQFVIERQSPRPGQHAGAGHKAGAVLGSILAVCEIMGRPIHLVVPGVWKRSLGLTRQEGEKDSSFKRRSLDKARLLFPNMREELALSKHEGRAEALLLAYYFTNRGRSHG